MRLEPNCIRDILLAVEEHTDFDNWLEFSPKQNVVDNYSYKVVMYHIYQCEDAGLIKVVGKTFDGHITIKDLTPLGHNFLAQIRSDTVFEKLKSIGAYSIQAMLQLAPQVIATLIKN